MSHRGQLIAILSNRLELRRVRWGITLFPPAPEYLMSLLFVFRILSSMIASIDRELTL